MPKENKKKLEPLGKKGTFVAYSETSTAYRIYIPKHRQAEVSQDVIFDEEVAFRKSKESHMEIDDEDKKAPRITNLDPPRPHSSEVQEESIEPSNQVDPPKEVAITRKRRAWLHDTLQDAERHATPRVENCN